MRILDEYGPVILEAKAGKFLPSARLPLSDITFVSSSVPCPDLWPPKPNEAISIRPLGQQYSQDWLALDYWAIEKTTVHTPSSPHIPDSKLSKALGNFASRKEEGSTRVKTKEKVVGASYVAISPSSSRVAFEILDLLEKKTLLFDKSTPSLNARAEMAVKIDLKRDELGCDMYSAPEHQLWFYIVAVNQLSRAYYDPRFG